MLPTRPEFILSTTVKEARRALIFSFSLICLATTALAGDINLLLEGEKDPVKVDLSLAEMSDTLKNLIGDLGGDLPEQSIPLLGVNLRTWKAIENSLKTMQKLQREGSTYQFKSMKEMVKNSFPTSAPINSADIFKFLLAANFWAIPDLLRPAAAAWVDLVNQEQPKKDVISVEDTLAEFITRLKDLGAPSDLFAYIEDYIKNPTSTIKEIGQPIKVDKSQIVLIKVGDTISVIDLAPHKSVNAVTTVEAKEEPNVLSIASGDKIYVVNRADNTISVINSTTKQSIGNPIAVDSAPTAFIIVGDNLYSVNLGHSLTNYLPNDPLKPWSRRENTIYTSAGDKIYEVEELKDGYTLSIFDFATKEIIGSPLKLTGLFPNFLIVAGDKLLIIKPDAISVFDLKQFLYYTKK